MFLCLNMALFTWCGIGIWFQGILRVQVQELSIGPIPCIPSVNGPKQRLLKTMAWLPTFALCILKDRVNNNIILLYILLFFAHLVVFCTSFLHILLSFAHLIVLHFFLFHCTFYSYFSFSYHMYALVLCYFI